jgi:hypothetical protein
LQTAQRQTELLQQQNRASQYRWHSNYQGSFAYQDANYGYTGYYVDQDEYNYYFRQGFRHGQGRRLERRSNRSMKG